MICLICAALYAGINPAKAPATTKIITVVSAVLKSTCGYFIKSLSIKGPTSYKSPKPKTSPNNPANIVTKTDSCKIIPIIDHG